MKREEFEKQYLDKEVLIQFFDDTFACGILKKDDPQTCLEDLPNYYHIRNHHFRKSHIKKITIKGLPSSVKCIC